MLIRALLILAIGFGFLFLARVGVARRRVFMSRWPAVAFALAAFWELSRGGVELALVCAALAIASWYIAPRILALAAAENLPEDAGDSQARAILGVSPVATEADIRRAYRAKMARAHPDQGGSQAEAARLTGARDRLLRKRR